VNAAEGTAIACGDESNVPSRRAILTTLGIGTVTGVGFLAGCSGGNQRATPAPRGTSATLSRDAAASPPTGDSQTRVPEPASTSAGTVPTGADIHHGPRSVPAVALTFHGSGDAAILRRMLQIFRSENARVTVLGVGQWLAAQPQDAKLILDGGHELGNHTWSHPTLPRLSPARTRIEIERAADELRKLTRTESRWFRPSGTPRSTATIRAAAVAAGYGACLSFDVDPLDYTDPGAASIVRNFAAQVRHGSIVSLHLGHQGTLAAIPEILSHLRQQGLAAVTVSHLLNIQ
jgi:peptidoglycan/xylan/chitin deacetylase (PgdA/CDA1 family)